MTYAVLPRAPGGTYFFTVRLQNKDATLLVDHVDVLRQAVRVARKRHPFEICAAVVLPATVHMIWTLPIDDANYAIRWRMIKSTFSRHIPMPEDAELTPTMRKRREKGIWQRRYWEHQIRDQSDFDLQEHLIIHAPVTSGLVKQPSDWALSSLHVRGVGRTRIASPPPLDFVHVASAEATLF